MGLAVTRLGLDAGGDGRGALPCVERRARADVQMHVPERDAWFRRTAWFRMLGRHRFMHHKRNNRHYNVVLPLADYLLGTAVAARRGDVREMLRLGYLRPRTGVGRRFVGSAPRPCALVANAHHIPA